MCAKVFGSLIANSKERAPISRGLALLGQVLKYRERSSFDVVKNFGPGRWPSARRAPSSSKIDEGMLSSESAAT